MSRGGDRGGRRPKTVDGAVKKSFILSRETAARLAQLAEDNAMSESAVLREILAGNLAASKRRS